MCSPVSTDEQQDEAPQEQGPRRYVDSIFSTVDRSTVTYGETETILSITLALQMDIYQPAQDSAVERPLIVLGHGGGFLSGNRRDALIVSLCEAFARRGYVTASYSYRLGVQQVSREGYAEAIVRAVQDAKAAVRYFHANAEQYRIDPESIFLGGVSAGAVTAVHYAYWQPDELAAAVDTGKTGGLAGSSGNPGYSSDIAAVINCWGAIADSVWIDPGEEPIVSVHGRDDDIVPYGVGCAYGLEQLQLYGSKIINRVARRVGIRSSLLTFDDIGHGLDRGDAEVDTMIEFIADFLSPLTATIIDLNMAEENYGFQAFVRKTVLAHRSRFDFHPNYSVAGQ
ncbi:MAG: alpha/beta hydrolase [Chitinivibrionales bacterium]